LLNPGVWYTEYQVTGIIALSKNLSRAFREKFYVFKTMRQALRPEHATCCFFSESSFHQQPETDACARREPSNRAGLRIQAKKNAGHPR
jgi:hypothetical protein